jgi:hypothetical protein
MASAKNIALATVAGLLVTMQALVFSFAMDLISSVVLVAIGFAAGRLSR